VHVVLGHDRQEAEKTEEAQGQCASGQRGRALSALRAADKTV
jgi:hypothetical protein